MMFNKKGKFQLTWPVVAVGLVALVVFGVIDLGNFKLGNLSVGSEEEPAPAPAVGTPGSPQQLTITNTASAGSVTDSLVIVATEAESDSPTILNGGIVNFYPAGVSPKDASATALAAVTIGTAYTGGRLSCGTTYRVVYENASEHYSKDFGDIVGIDCGADYTEENADSLIDISTNSRYGNYKPVAVATISDIFDETNTDGRMNGQTNTSIEVAANEIGCTLGGACGADGTIIYDVSQGDGSFYMDVTPAVTGSQDQLKEPVLCFTYDQTNPPEGDEVSALTVSLRTGTDLEIPGSTNWANVFAAQECVKLKDPMISGDSSTIRMTFTYNEANVGANDDYFIVFDDLGEDRGKDDALNTGATRDIITMDAQA